MITYSYSYAYHLGRYPNYDFNAKEGQLNMTFFFAVLWNDFKNITINLTFVKDVLVALNDNLEFEKVSTNTYQYA